MSFLFLLCSLRTILILTPAPFLLIASRIPSLLPHTLLPDRHDDCPFLFCSVFILHYVGTLDDWLRLRAHLRLLHMSLRPLHPLCTSYSRSRLHLYVQRRNSLPRPHSRFTTSHPNHTVAISMHALTPSPSQISLIVFVSKPSISCRRSSQSLQSS